MIFEKVNEFRKIDNITTEAFIHNFTNLSEVLLPTMNT
jgi:hypothetical protein